MVARWICVTLGEENLVEAKKKWQDQRRTGNAEETPFEKERKATSHKTMKNSVCTIDSILLQAVWCVPM